MPNKKVKVIVAMSGGVDSSVAAALIKKQGYDVHGFFMRLWKEPRSGRGSTTRILRVIEDSAELNAKAVAEKLGIPLEILDFRKEFKKAVVDYFLKEFSQARTPNPCVVCNQQIKFGLLLDKALEMRADYVATGHYARVKKIHSIPIRLSARPKPPLKKEGVYRLLTAKDKTKDQSYFLYTLMPKKLKRILFPIGDYKKIEVYKIAEELKLPYKKGESVDICFLAGQDHRDFLKKYLKLKVGKIVDTGGKILGGHRGLSLYTIGQRADIGGPGPFYVVEMNMKRNELVVTNKPRDLMLFKKVLKAGNVNWVSGKKPKLPLRCRARIRYGHAAVECVVEKGHKVIFKNPQRAITPGQSVVFYRRDEVLGGGVIS